MDSPVLTFVSTSIRTAVQTQKKSNDIACKRDLFYYGIGGAHVCYGISEGCVCFGSYGGTSCLRLLRNSGVFPVVSLGRASVIQLLHEVRSHRTSLRYLRRKQRWCRVCHSVIRMEFRGWYMSCDYVLWSPTSGDETP